MPISPPFLDRGQGPEHHPLLGSDPSSLLTYVVWARPITGLKRGFCAASDSPPFLPSGHEPVPAASGYDTVTVEASLRPLALKLAQWLS